MVNSNEDSLYDPNSNENSTYIKYIFRKGFYKYKNTLVSYCIAPERVINVNLMRSLRGTLVFCDRIPSCKNLIRWMEAWEKMELLKK